MHLTLHKIKQNIFFRFFPHDVGSQLSFGSLQPSFIHAHLFMLWKCCISQTVRENVPRRPLFYEISRCFDASLNLRPIRHRERWRDYWCNITEFIAGWGPSGHKRTFTSNHKFVAVSYKHSSIAWSSFCADKCETFMLNHNYLKIYDNKQVVRHLHYRRNIPPLPLFPEISVKDP